MTFFGYVQDEQLAGVMGLESIKDVSLIRHAYVSPECQNRGVGENSSAISLTRLLVQIYSLGHGQAHTGLSISIKNTALIYYRIKINY